MKPELSPGARRFRRILLAASLVFLVGSLVFTLVTADRRRGSEEQRELLEYFQHRFPPLHAQTMSVQAAMSQLIDADSPRPATAVELLDENIMPSTDDILRQAREMPMQTIDGKALHIAYIQALEGLRRDQQEMRRIFADETRDPEERRMSARALTGQALARFDKFYKRTREVLIELGIQPVEAADAGPTR